LEAQYEGNVIQEWREWVLISPFQAKRTNFPLTECVESCIILVSDQNVNHIANHFSKFLLTHNHYKTNIIYINIMVIMGISVSTCSQWFNLNGQLKIRMRVTDALSCEVRLHNSNLPSFVGL
jgi:hypothetical protein